MTATVVHVQQRGQDRYLATCKADGFVSPPIGAYTTEAPAQESADRHNALKHPPVAADEDPEFDNDPDSRSGF